MRCLTCQYNLSRLTPGAKGMHHCPECGRAFDPSDADTFDHAARGGSRLRVAIIFWVVILPFGYLLMYRSFGPPSGPVEFLLTTLGAICFAAIAIGPLWLLYVAIAALREDTFDRDG